MKILIKNLQQIIKINPQHLKKLIKKICYLLGINKGVISFVFTDNKNIRVLNKEYFKRDYPTDVISFDLRDEFDFLNILGEIIISVEKALENSQRFSTDFKKELLLYIIHGLLHLLGFEDKTYWGKRKMRKKEKDLLFLIDKKEKKLITSLIS